jgi:hypothetical protein
VRAQIYLPLPDYSFLPESQERTVADRRSSKSVTKPALNAENAAALA